MKQINFLVLFCYPCYSFDFLPRSRYFQQLSVKNLIKGIDHNDFDKVYFSSDMKKVYTQDDENDINYYSNINPIVGEKIVDMTIQKDVDPVFIPEQNQFASFGITLYYSALIYIAINLFATLFRVVFNGGMRSNSNSNNFGIGNSFTSNLFGGGSQSKFIVSLDS
mgnify:CR=1 FL=1